MASILVVDDEIGIREFLAESLVTDQHDVSQAVNGDAAVRAIDQQSFDLMITDLRMPGSIDGLGVVRHARVAQPGMRVIVLTAHGTVSVAVEALKLGAIDFLEKPIAGPSQLRAMVQRALEQRRRDRPGRRVPVGETDPIRLLAADVERALGSNYRVEETIGRGGYAAVFRVHDTVLDRKLAAKALYPELAAVATIADQFRREAQTASRLRHPAIVPVLFVGGEDDAPCLVMPLVVGSTLAERLRTGPLPVTETLAVAADIAAALDFAHQSGVIHRDVKPENVLLDRESGHALLADFGIASALEGDPRRTGPGIVTGTPLYLSPEQAAGVRPLDPRSDQYSLAVVIHEMLVGHPPFVGSNSRAIAAQHVAAPVPSLRTTRPELSEALDRLLARGLAKNPVERFASCGELVGALNASIGRRGADSIFRRLIRFGERR